VEEKTGAVVVASAVIKLLGVTGVRSGEHSVQLCKSTSTAALQTAQKASNSPISSGLLLRRLRGVL
jgi:hypothetical protein